MHYVRFNVLLAFAIIFLLAPFSMVALAAVCSSKTIACPRGQSTYFAPVGSGVCTNGGYYCKTTAPPPAISLSFGARGSAVTTLQRKLISLGYLTSDSATGYFGPLTRAAVLRFQCDRKIVCSGGEISTG